jgi:hypothetical protein
LIDVAKTFQLDRADREASRLSTRIDRARRLLLVGGASLLKTWLALGGSVVTFASAHPLLPPALLRDRPVTRSLLSQWTTFERDARVASQDFMQAMLAGSSRRRA